MGATLEGIVGQADSGAPRSAAALAVALRDAREHTLRSYAHLTEREQQFPRRPTVNPPRWEVGHIGWFQEFWCRRYSSADPRGSATPSRLAGADAWFDSRSVPHDLRWDLPIPAWEGIHAYLRDTLDDTLTALARTGDGERYFFELALYHEDMHGEALLMTLQSLALPPAAKLRPRRERSRADGDLPLPGGAFVVGTAPSESGRFVFDNEKYAHEVVLAPFAISRRCVDEGEFAAFVDDGGYLRPEWWSRAGRAWLSTAGRRMPAYWRRAPGGFEVRAFDRWRALEPARTLCHVNAYEAEAWCAWAGRRLPTESEWEAAALHGLSATPGEVWEWTATPFAPYPGFAADPYEEYSQPWFHDHRVLRGGSWATAPRLVHPRFRNFYLPERHDPFAGFRSCAGD